MQHNKHKNILKHTKTAINVCHTLRLPYLIWHITFSLLFSITLPAEHKQYIIYGSNNSRALIAFYRNGCRRVFSFQN